LRSGIAKRRSYASILVIPQRKTVLVGALQRRRPWSGGKGWAGYGAGIGGAMRVPALREREAQSDGSFFVRAATLCRKEGEEREEKKEKGRKKGEKEKRENFPNLNFFGKKIKDNL
jgi:hypothetical protein